MTHAEFGKAELVLGWRGEEEKVEKALCSLISQKCSRQDIICFGCSAAQCDVKRHTQSRSRGSRREKILHSVFGCSRIRLAAYQVELSLNAGVREAGAYFSVLYSQ